MQFRYDVNQFPYQLASWSRTRFAVVPLSNARQSDWGWAFR